MDVSFIFFIRFYDHANFIQELVFQRYESVLTPCFSDYMDREFMLRKLLPFNPCMVDFVRQKYQRLLEGKQKTVSVHFRLGSNSVYFKPLAQPTFDWYKDVMATNFGKVDALFMLFTDNVPELRTRLSETNLMQGRPFEIIDEDFAHGLLMMTMCKHHVASNSKTAFWGAFLDAKQPKSGLAVFPSLFFKHHRIRPVPFHDWIVK